MRNMQAAVRTTPSSGCAPRLRAKKPWAARRANCLATTSTAAYIRWSANRKSMPCWKRSKRAKASAPSRVSGLDSLNPADSRVEQQLGSYLGARISRFSTLGSGWQTDVFEFEVPSPCSRADIPTRQPLVLKIYQAGMAAEKCARE